MSNLQKTIPRLLLLSFALIKVRLKPFN
jgi:hypothetical protein